MINPFKIGQLVNYVRMTEGLPEEIAAICLELETEYSQVPPSSSPNKKSGKHEWSPEQRAAAAERLRARQAAKKQQQEESEDEQETL